MAKREVAEAMSFWPIDDRPREKMLRKGAEHLGDSELLAVLIGTGLPNGSAFDLAQRLLKKYENLHGLSTRISKELSDEPGIGPAKSTRLMAAFELGRRVAGGPPLLPGALFRESRQVFEQYGPRFRDRKQEEFWILLLDTKSRVIREVAVSKGTLNASLVHPRDVFGPALREKASSVILFHNHPSGDPAPSPEDRMLTERFMQAGNLLGIKVLDHVILGRDRYHSFTDGF